jgi:hypothetical protein
MISLYYIFIYVCYPFFYLNNLSFTKEWYTGADLGVGSGQLTHS